MEEEDAAIAGQGGPQNMVSLLLGRGEVLAGTRGVPKAEHDVGSRLEGRQCAFELGGVLTKVSALL